MTTAEFYDYVGGDYDDVKYRFMKDELISRFLRMLPDDGSMDELNAAVAAGSSEGAFRAVHTLKGVAATLGFDGLTTTASVLTEKLRPQTGFPDDEYFSAVGREYDRVIAAAGQLED